jgi:hypothetical protein
VDNKTITLDDLRDVMQPFHLEHIRKQLMHRPKPKRRRKLLADGRVLHVTKGFRGKKRRKS